MSISWRCITGLSKFNLQKAISGLKTKFNVQDFTIERHEESQNQQYAGESGRTKTKLGTQLYNANECLAERTVVFS